MPVVMSFHSCLSRGKGTDGRPLLQWNGPVLPSGWSNSPEARALLSLPAAGASMVRDYVTSFLVGVGQRTATEDETIDAAELITMPLSVIVFGATGDLARKKIFPALYQLCMLGYFPRDLLVVAYGRTKHELDSFVRQQLVNVVEDPRFSKDDFVQRLSYRAGNYDAPESFVGLERELCGHEGGAPSNRLYFLAVPPSVFGPICEMVSLYAAAAEGGHTRVIIEKPFGRDSESFAQLHEVTTRHFREPQLFRMDHYRCAHSAGRNRMSPWKPSTPLDERRRCALS